MSFPMFDDDVIDLRNAWVERYSSYGRYQQQTPEDNIRDATYYVIRYSWSREAGANHESAKQQMLRLMDIEAGVTPPPMELPALRADGPWLIDATGQLTWPRSLTAFLLLKRLLQGDTSSALDYMDWAQSQGFTMLRVFSQVDWDGTSSGVEKGFLASDYNQDVYNEAVHQLLREAANRQQYVELVGHTFAYDIGQMAQHLQRCNGLCSSHTNALLEVTNEPPRNNIDINGLLQRYKPDLRLWASGKYDPNPWPGGPYTTDHPPRDDQWPRKFKGSIELQDGSGPWSPFQPPYKGPCFLDEPIRIEESGLSPDDWQAWGSGARLFAASALIHGGDWAQRCRIPKLPKVLECIKAFHAGVNAVPHQRYSGYDHPNDLNDQGAQNGHRRYRRQGQDGLWYEISVRPYHFKVV